MWPVNIKARIQKMRSYQKRKRTIDEVEDEDLELPALPLTRPPEMWTALTIVRALDDRDPTTWSDNTVQVFHGTIKTVDVVL
jgi:hypothetical protein